jgi:hypothetical protein
MRIRQCAAARPDWRRGRISSGVPDDRWAFTTHTTPLNYGAVAALAEASRVLHGYDDAQAQRCRGSLTQTAGDCIEKLSLTVLAQLPEHHSAEPTLEDVMSLDRD